MRERVLSAHYPTTHFTPFRTEITTTYAPEANVDIPAEACAFTPPR